MSPHVAAQLASTLTPRQNSQAAFDAATGTVVLFGGWVSSSHSYLGDTWTWDGASWTQQTPPVSPSARSDAMMAYDPDTRTVVLFGGESAAGTLQDTWTWNGVTWTPMSPATAPPTLQDAGMTYDPIHHQVVLFGGSDSGGVSDAYCDWQSSRCNGTWTWDGTTWTEHAPATVPCVRDQGLLAFDPVTQRVLLFGGFHDDPYAACPTGSFNYLDDTWTWDGTTWTQLTPSQSPVWTSSGGMALDPAHNRVALVGAITQNNTNDVFQWTGTTWTQLQARRSPPATKWMPVVADLAHSSLLQIGGYNYTTGADVSDTWGWDGASWTDPPTLEQEPPDGGAPTAHEQAGQGNICYPCLIKQLLALLTLVADPVNTEYGTLSESVADLAVPGRGAPLAFTRTYDSINAGATGPLGYGWTFGAGASLSQDPTTGTVTISQENGSQVTFLKQGTTYVPSAPRIIATLVQNTDGSWTLTRQARERLTFSSAGKLLSSGDLNGYTTTYTYDATTGHLTTITDSASRSLTLAYTGNLITSVSDPIGRKITFAYNDGAGDLTDVTDVNGGVTHLTYDAGHRLLTRTDPRGGLVSNQYDSNGRVVNQTVTVVAGDHSKDRTTTFAYSGDPTSQAGGTATITDPKGDVTQLTYQFGVQTQRTLGVGTPQAATWQYFYSPTTLGMTTVIDPNGHRSYTSYDANGNAVESIDALGRTTTKSYDALNDVTSMTDPTGVTTTMTYDANGNLLATSRPLAGTSPVQNQVVTYQHGDSTHPGDVTGMVDPDGKTWHYTYDTYGDQTSATDPLGDQSTTAYNTVGWVTSTVSPKGNVSGCNCASQYTTSLSYTDPQTGALDGFGDVRTITDPLGHVTTRSYDADRNVVSVIDPNGNTTQYRYDLANERTDTIRADGTDLHTDYFVDGTVKDQVDAAGNVTSYGYDALARETSETTPVTTACPTGCTTSYTYDATGNRLTAVDPLQQTTTYTYDAANELTSISYSDGKTPNVTGLTYDPDGRRTQMTDGTGTSHWAYDSLGRMTSYQNGAGAAVQYGYDLKGQLTAITYPNGKVVSRGYDDAGRFTSVTDWLGHTSTFTPDVEANVVTESYPNTVSASLGYDNADRLTSITDSSTGGGTLAGMAYQRDADGQVASETGSGHLAGASTYSYTPLNQLGSVNAGSYAYDAADNLTRQPTSTSQAFDAGDELAATRSAISLVGTAAGGDAGTSAAVTLPLPAGVAAGDQVILASTQAAADTVGTPAGYTQVGTATSGGPTPGETIVWRHTVVPGDAAVVIPYDGLFPKSVVLAVYRGVGATTPVDAQSSGADPLGSTLVVPSVTTTTPADTLLMVAGATGNAAAAAWTPATGMVGETAMGTIPLVSSSLADQTLTAMGATGARTATFGGSAQLTGLLVALRPSTPATYTYDSRGDRTAVTPPGGSAATTYVYDQANRLSAFTGGSGSSATYSYDGDGLRMAKTVVSGAVPVTTSFAWDESGGMPQLLSDGVNSYLYGPLGPVEQISSTSVVDYFLGDHLGATRLLTDASGAVAATFTYDPYGNQTASSGTATTPLLYAGQYRDAESGMYYLRARYYDPASAQFVTRDPLASMTGEPYGYAGDNPLDASDPSGLNSTSMSPDAQHCDAGPDSGDATWVWCGNASSQDAYAPAAQDVHGLNTDIWAPGPRTPDWTVIQASGSFAIAGGTALIVTRYGHVFLSGGFGGGLKGWAVAGGSGWLGDPFDKKAPDSCTLDNFISGWTYQADVQLIGDLSMIYNPSTGQVGWAAGAGFGLGMSGMASWAQRIQ
jgi:RHS repeat-associated protein